jgi:hypothetical protein
VRAALLVIVLVLAGCAFPAAPERPITVTTGPAARIRQICTEALGRTATGCLLREGGRLIVFCPYSDARCLAQELERASEAASSRPVTHDNGSASP